MKAKDTKARVLQPTSELLRWLALEPIEYTIESSKDPDFVRK